MGQSVGGDKWKNEWGIRFLQQHLNRSAWRQNFKIYCSGDWVCVSRKSNFWVCIIHLDFKDKVNIFSGYGKY